MTAHTIGSSATDSGHDTVPATQTFRPFRSSAAILSAIVLAVLIEVTSRLLRERYSELAALAEVGSLGAILVLLSPAMYLIFKLDGARPLKVSLLLALLFLAMTQVLNITARFPQVDAWPVLSAHDKWHDIAHWVFMVLGLVLMLTCLYLALLEAVHAKASLIAESKELVREIAERKRAEAALSGQERLYSQAIAQAGAIPYRINWKTRSFTFFQHDICELTGYSKEELTFDRIARLPVERRLFGPLAHMTEVELARKFEAGEIRSWRAEYRIKTKDGRELWISDSSVENVGSDGKPAESVGLFQDITERKREEEAVSRNERHFRALIENALDLITVLSADGVILYESPSVTRILGFTPKELVGLNIVDFAHPDDRDLCRSALAAALNSPQTTPGFNLRVRHMNGSWRVLESIGRSVLDDPALTGAVVVNSRDITERVTLEQQLLQSQKMEGIGRLAGGVAHDFNNLLTCILGYGDLALACAPEGNRIHSHVELMLEAARRASDLTRQLLAFARKHPVEPRRTDLNTLATNLAKMLRRLIGEDIELATFLSSEPAVVTIDPGSFEQVIINLAINARDAMPDGGKLTIEVGSTYLDRTYAKIHPEVTPGEYVVLAVSDSGVGMTADVKEHIFEPFFTTKEENKGTGLGLATCYGVVKQAGGHLGVYSEPGTGTTFNIYLPRIDAAAPIEERPRTERRTEYEFAKGTETILLVEDDPLVRSITVEALTAIGYNVLDAQDGSAALEMAREHPATIHVLVTDVVMPQMSGQQVAREIVRARPETKVLFMSGYTEDAILRQGVLEGEISFLHKPFTPSILANKLRAVIEEA
ncbi:MAG: PAS domain S-box protein [Candidatus Hydrogenedentes bacterium]|nr:PAS domain S-box protein [Candidatus Hydrogenedentota bacterium]